MPPVGFETTISAGERPQIYALDRVVTGTDEVIPLGRKKLNLLASGKSLLKRSKRVSVMSAIDIA
jgi:hypothetical protein